MPNGSTELNIVFVASEAAPFAKTGGLADVCGALPVELQRQGHDVAVIIPYYRQVKNGGHEIEPLHVKFDVPIGSKIVRGTAVAGPFAGFGRAGLFCGERRLLRPRRSLSL